MVVIRVNVTDERIKHIMVMTDSCAVRVNATVSFISPGICWRLQ